jgi:hypothetical protein
LHQCVSFSKRLDGCSAENPKIFDERAAALPGKCQRSCHTFTGGCSNRKRKIAFAAKPKTCDARTILNKERRVEQATHARHVPHIIGMNNRSVAKSMLALMGSIDGLVDIPTAHKWNKWHHLFYGNKWV